MLSDEVAERTAQQLEAYPEQDERHFAELKAILDESSPITAAESQHFAVIAVGEFDGETSALASWRPAICGWRIKLCRALTVLALGAYSRSSQGRPRCCCQPALHLESMIFGMWL